MGRENRKSTGITRDVSDGNLQGNYASILGQEREKDKVGSILEVPSASCAAKPWLDF